MKLFILGLFLFPALEANSIVDSTIYSDGFEFKEGIYRSIDEFKANNPSIKIENVVVDIELEQTTKQIISSESFLYRDGTGFNRSIKSKDIWGYCIDGSVFIGGHLVFKMGSIMLYTATKTSWKGSSGLDRHGYSNNYSRSSIKEVPFIMDFRTGNFMKFTLENFLSLLKLDKELYQEFTAINSYKKKKQLMFIYLNRFNERNPIYFP